MYKDLIVKYINNMEQYCEIKINTNWAGVEYEFRNRTNEDSERIISVEVCPITIY